MFLSSDSALLMYIHDTDTYILLTKVPTWLFTITGIIILLIGLIIVAAGQILQAVLHTANNSFEILEVIADIAYNQEPNDESTSKLYKPQFNRWISAYSVDQCIYGYTDNGKIASWHN